MKSRTIYARSAKIVSGVLHPLAMPLYLLLFFLSSHTFRAIYPLRVRIYLVWVVVLFTTVVPVLMLALLKVYRKISDMELSRRRERIVPLLVTVVCYTLCAVAVWRVPFAQLLSRFLFAAACCAVVCTIVSMRWKISLHLTAAGAATGFVLLSHIAADGELFGALVAVVSGTGVLASARLYSGYHTPGQVAGGFFTGLFVVFAVLLGG